MIFDTTYYLRCISTLNKAYSLLISTNPELIEYDLYRSACIKEFEIILEQSGKLMRKLLKPYFPTGKDVDKLYFKDLFRHALLRDILSEEECERWINYRDNRNSTSHDYGVNFAQETLKLIPQFILDSYSLAEFINKMKYDSER